MSAQELITEHLDLWTGAVTKKSSSGRGSNAKVELTGIKKLRELILELAVRGKLLTQDAGDECASALLDRIKGIEQELVKSKRIRKPKHLVSVSRKEAEFTLPSSWQWVRLGTIGQIVGGGTPKSAEPSYWSDKGIPWLTPADLYGLKEKYIASGNRDISELGLAKSSAQLLPVGSVLFSSRAPIGYVAITTGELATNQGFKSCAPYIQEMNQFIYYFLKRSAPYIDASASGTTFKEVSGTKVASILMPLPPLEEQKRIVQKVDELMALCDRLEQQTSDQLEAHETLVDTLLGTLTQSENATELADNWARLAAHFDALFTTEQSIDKLKQTILQLAVMGRLVEQDAEDEPASELLDSITAERQELVQSGKIRTPKITANTDLQISPPFPLPRNWNWARLGELFAIVTDGDHQAPPKSKEGIPFLVIGNLNTGRIDFAGCKHVNEGYYYQLDWSRKPTNGDLLYTVTGSYGIPVKVLTSKAFCVQRHVAILRATASTPRDYVKLVLESEYGQSYADEIATGIAQKTVPLTGLRKMPIPLPPLSEQYRIVQKVDELLALCDQLKERLTELGSTRHDLALAAVDRALDC